MADDQTQRPYRSNPTPTRNAPGVAPAGGSSGSDPLAELARLIGQNDPFAEYGRQNVAHRAAAPVQAPPVAPAAAPQWSAPAPAAHAPPISPPPAPDMHPAEYAPPAYGAHGYVEEAGEYDQHGYDPSTAHAGAEQQDFYDDVPPRRRMGILAIAAVFALAVVGTAGAFGYRALFGSAGSSGPPPVIKADTTPSKVVPAKDKDAKNGKLIYDRVADKDQGEKLVSRQEQPLDINNKPAGVVMPRDENGMPSGSIQPALGSGVVGAEPKKIHTLAIRPDGTVMADAGPAQTTPPMPSMQPVQPAQPMPPAQQARPAPAAPAPATPAPAPPPSAPRQASAPAEPPERHAAAPEHHVAPPRNAPLSLSPDAAEPARKVERPTQTAHAAQPTQPMQTMPAAQPTPAAPPARTASVDASATGGYAVQLASRHNEAEAQSSFQSLQAKYPQQLGGRQPLIRRVDLGAKGIYYRAMVGPFGSSDEASQLCSSIKAAGGACFVQRI